MKRTIIFALCLLTFVACNTNNDPVVDWKKNYEAYVHDNIDTASYQRQIECYIDNDDVPELCLFGESYADGAIILTQYKGKVVKLDCYWSPEYIERSGLINNSYGHMGTSGTEIIKLDHGVFEEILHTEAVWHEGDSDQAPYFVYTINEQVVDTLYGEDVTEESCSRINDTIEKVYYSKGTSKSL